MMEEKPEKRPKGRPVGWRKPKPETEPKPPAKRGRPCVWIESPKTGTISCLPQFFELFKLEEFKNAVQDLTLEYATRKEPNT